MNDKSIVKNKLKKVMAVIVGIFTLVVTGYLMLLCFDYNKEQTFITEILPIILGVIVIIGIGLFWDEDSVGRRYIRYKKWSAFGNRLKVAYEAKFGYSNPAFNQEIDHHVKAMRSLGKGYSKSINYNRLKALSKFVEVPFTVPEEEMLAEEDKTRSFSVNSGE